MRKMIARLGDLMLVRLAPRATAQASGWFDCGCNADRNGNCWVTQYYCDDAVGCGPCTTLTTRRCTC
jgi:hypothetical protein